MKMVYAGKVREHVRKYFNPEGFDPLAFRDMAKLALLALLLSELVVYIFLQQSADLGELPHNITDVIIISISLLEFLVVPIISGQGSKRRRSVLVGWTMAALVTTIPLFALPNPDITVDEGLCTTAVPLAPRSFVTGISTKAAVRLSMLLICGVVSALGRAAFFSHGLAYLDEHNPSYNLHMHVGLFILYRVLVYILGSSMRTMTLDMPWLQILIIVIKLLLTLLRLYRYPEAVPAPEKERRSGTGLLRSMGRVLRNGVGVLQILAMALLAAAWRGFGLQEAAFVQVKYYVRPDNDSQMGIMNIYLKVISIILGVILVGYIYTAPVMPKFDRKAAVANAAKMTFQATVFYVGMTALLSCNRSEIGGLTELNYTQPTCGRSCGCDRPWMEFTPVCVPEQMTTYFSPCHAGCATSDTVNTIGVYSNCSCAPGLRVTKGACDDGSCASMYNLHQMFYVTLCLVSTLAFTWQTTVLLESVDKRDVAMAVGLASSVVSLVAFVGAHGFYMGISLFTCAFTRGSKCLLHNELFAPWVGYSSAVLAGLAFILTIISCVLLRRQKEPKEEDVSLG
ncbi:solute carrier organic anion transporter family member 2B1-like isoform X2 [Cydia pomonella]|uniref:solute carrier organic anion transporter family member 2B1-like isoform X2 n=1 Tax=Cydia pomonella TaxID=82600 RepID=UPI002ADD8718|nr:solute carrier organic anion transporter family member 2B1-like isoform X2 [Cydia pomonella]